MTNRLVRPPVASPPGNHFLPWLRNSDWKSSSGKTFAIGEMSTEHLWNVLGYLRWHAEDLMAIVPDCEGMTPDEMISAQPIWHAIARELVARKELSAKEDLWSVLRSAGEVPWERANRRKLAAAASRARRKALPSAGIRITP